MQLGLYGDTDKRPLVYALFKLLQNYGDILFISKNKQYLRLSDTRDSGGYYQNIMIVATELSYDEIWETIGHNADDFKHVIYDMDSDNIPDDLDHTIVCRTMVKADGEDASLEWIDSPMGEIKFNFDGKDGFFARLFKKKDTEILNIEMSGELWRYVETVEACRLLPPVPECGIVDILTENVGELLKLDRASIYTLLNEGEGM